MARIPSGFPFRPHAFVPNGFRRLLSFEGRTGAVSPRRRSHT